MDWHTIETAPAEEIVMTKIDDKDGVRNEQLMLRRGNLWWINVGEPGEMYVYYTPTHWRRQGDSLTASNPDQEINVHHRLKPT